MNANWSVKVEYLHFDVGHTDRKWNPCYIFDGGLIYYNDNNFHFRNDITAETVKLGVNYHIT